MHPKRKTIFSQLQPNISLQESPIGSPSHCDSDRSPEPYFYPTSHQPKMPKHVNVKVTVTNLLVQLKEWLIELCLSQSYIAQINQQLSPIVDELIESGSHNTSSSWLEAFNLNTNQVSVKQNSNIYLDSDEGNHKIYSVLQPEQKTEIALLAQNDKYLVEVYFQKYFRLLQNCLKRISRFEGEKKLKFLVDTTTKNIFSQTLRVSYDLKLIEHRLKQQKQIKTELCSNGYLYLLAQRLSVLLRDRGNVSAAFGRLKKQYFEGRKRDHVFVQGMMKNISNLCNLYTRNKRNRVNWNFYRWRLASLEMKIHQEESLVQIARSMIRDLTPCLAPGDDLETYRSSWRLQFQNQINLMIESLFTGEQCVFISLESLMRAPLHQHKMSIVELLQQQDQLCITHRSYKEHQFLNQLSIDELKNCIITGQIYKSDRTNTTLLLIPIKPIKGIIFASLEKQHQNSLSFNKCPMTMKSFRILLRIVELVTPLLEDVTELCKKVEAEWNETNRSGHYGLLFREFMKNDMEFSRVGKGYLQITERDEEGVQIDSHRLETPTSVFSSVMENLSISTLMVYHINPSCQIKDMPCVVIGDWDWAKTQRQLVKSIFSELVSSGKEMLTISRSARTFVLFPLKHNGEIEGLIHCLLTQEGKQNSSDLDYAVIVDALVPLLMRHQGAMNCQICNVEVNLPETMGEKAVGASPTQRKLSFESALKVVTAQTISQLTLTLSSLLQQKGYFFSQLIFKLNLSDPSNYFYISSDSLNYLQIQAQYQIKHSDIYIEESASLSAGGVLSKLVHNFPCFSNPSIHVYQNENTRNFRMIAVPIKKNSKMFGYWLIGHYLLDQHSQNSEIIEFIKEIQKCMAMSRLFKSRKINDPSLEKELQAITSEEEEREREIVDRVRRIKGVGKLHQQFEQVKDAVGAHFKSIGQYLVKVNSHNELVQIKSNNSMVEDTVPIELDEESVQLLKSSSVLYSHQKILSQVCKIKQPKEHRTIRPMKYEKLHDIQIFLPELQEHLKQELTLKLKKEYQLQGWSSCQNSMFLNGIVQELSKSQSDEEKFVTVVNIGQFIRGDHYYYILQGKLEEVSTERFITQIQLKLRRILGSAIQNLPSQQTKKIQLLSLNSLVQNGLTKQYCVRKFKQNWKEEVLKGNKLLSALNKLLRPEGQKELRYFGLIQAGFEKLKNHSERIRYRYNTMCVVMSQILVRAQKMGHYEIGFRGIQESIQEPCHFNQIRSINKFIKILQNTAIKVVTSPFKTLKQYAAFKFNQTELSKKLSVQILLNFFNKTHMKSGQLHFWHQISKLDHSFEMNIRLIGQQFSKMSFRSRELFLKFANERFKAVLNHLDFGLMERVEIMCGFACSQERLVYKINSQNTLQECYSNTEEAHQQLIAEKGIIEIPVDTLLGNKKHFIYAKLSTKNSAKCEKEKQLLRKVLEEGLVPSYSQYLNIIEEKTHKMSEVLLRVTCKELWNGSCSQAQRLYAFSNDKCLEYQCSKLSFINALKSLRHSQTISQTKLISASINSQSKSLYTLEYEYNSLSSLLSGSNIDNSHYESILQKYGQIITREKLSSLREELEKLEYEEQRKSLQYQIKSKTFATSQIITFLEKKTNDQIQGVSQYYLGGQRNKENVEMNRSNYSLAFNERVYVEKKLQLGGVKEEVRLQQKKLKKMASRAIWLILSRLHRKNEKIAARSIFTRILLPRSVNIRV